MDPVSQTQASEDLAHRGLSVVGWYHSHPTFSATPSVRDIETQAKFQVSCELLYGYIIGYIIGHACAFSSHRQSIELFLHAFACLFLLAFADTKFCNRFGLGMVR